MNKLVLDSNIIDYCEELKLTKDFFDVLNVEIWVPTYVKNEILNSKKQHLIDKLSEIEYKRIGFFGFKNNPDALGFGAGNFYSQEYDTFIKKTVEKHKNDRYIALLSKINNAIFITSDNKIFQDACNNDVFSIFVTKDQKSYDKAIKHSNYVHLKSPWKKEDFEKIIRENVNRLN